MKALFGRASRVRGLVLGFGLGDAIGTGGRAEAEVLRSGVASQLLAFTIEGLIRAWVRGDHKGICHPPSVVWRAYCRWAFLQGIEPERMRTQGSGGKAVPDGWLAQVPLLRERRGNAPATVAALRNGEEGTLERPAGHSLGSHALTRTLVAGAIEDPDWVVDTARGVAALTHAPEAAEVATVGAWVVHSLLRAEDPARGLDEAVASVSGQGAVGRRVAEALEIGRRSPRSKHVLRELAPDHSASAVLAGTIYCVASFPDRDTIARAIDFAAQAHDGAGVAASTGALLGAVHGVEALDVALVSLLELSWVLDTLARDLVAQFRLRPSGGGYTAAADPHWRDRYPG